MKILVSIHIKVYQIDVFLFSVRKKKNLLKEYKVWILTLEQLLQPIFKRYIGGFVLLIFLDVDYCKKINCICSKASKSNLWFVYLLVLVSKKCLYLLTLFTKRLHDKLFWITLLKQYQGASLLLQEFLRITANLLKWNVHMQIYL